MNTNYYIYIDIYNIYILIDIDRFRLGLGWEG